jgi:dienelactone hydrolase
MMLRWYGMTGWRNVMAAVLLCLATTCGASGHLNEFDLSLREEFVRIPLPSEARWPMLAATTYRPKGEGPFPLIVLNHGSPATAAEREKMGRWRMLNIIQEFIIRGYAVVVPMRRGYGMTGGKWAENYGACNAPDYFAAGEQAAIDVVAAVNYAVRQPWVDRNQIVLAGQSAGGFAAIAAASKRPPGVVAVVNFAGGRGGRPDLRPGDPCDADNMRRAISRYALTIRVPVLWHYSENDRYFGPEHVNSWFRAFEAAGAPGTLVMQPPFGRDGHNLFVSPAGRSIWALAFDVFMMRTGYSLPVLANKNYNN